MPWSELLKKKYVEKIVVDGTAKALLKQVGIELDPTRSVSSEIIKPTYDSVKYLYNRVKYRQIREPENKQEIKLNVEQEPQAEIEPKSHPKRELSSEPSHEQEIEPDNSSDQLIENIRNIEKEYTQTTNELEQAQVEYTPRKHEAVEQTREADRMERRLEDIENLEASPEIYEQALERFEREYNTKPQNAPTKIKELREQSSKINQELKPMSEKIESLKNTQTQNIKKYDKEMSNLSKRPDKKEISNKLQQLREREGLKPRDIKGLRKIEQPNLKGQELARAH